MHLVVGASGTVGSRVVTRLLDRGEAVRAVSRDPARVAALAGRGAAAVRGDLRQEGWMDAALEGVESLVLAAQGLVPPTLDNHPGRSDLRGNRRLLARTRDSGMRRVVFLSVSNAAADARALYSRVKHAVEEEVRASSPSWAIVRPTVFIETHAVTLQAEPLWHGRKVQFFGTARTPVNWISAEDVADFVTRAAMGETARDRVAVIGGPDVMSRLDALEVVEEVLGRRAKRAQVPAGALRTMRLVLGPFHAGMRYLLDMALAEEAGASDFAPATLDWRGPTTVREVVERWAAGRPPQRPPTRP